MVRIDVLNATQHEANTALSPEIRKEKRKYIKGTAAKQKVIKSY